MCQKKTGKIVTFLLLLAVLAGAVRGEDKPTVSLVMSDASSRTAVEAVRKVHEAYPSLKEKVAIQPYAAQNIKSADTEAIADSRVAFLFMFDRDMADRLKPSLRSVVDNGGTVYTVDYLFPGRHEELGFTVDDDICAYYEARGSGNLSQALLYALHHNLGFQVDYDQPDPYPEVGIYDHHSGHIFEKVEKYKERYARNRRDYNPDAPWIGLVFYVSDLAGGQMDIIDALLASLEEKGVNVVPAFGYPSEDVLKNVFLRPDGTSRVDAVIASAMKFGVSPETSQRLLGKMNVPVINTMCLYSQSEQEWRESSVGLEINERTWQIANPEMAGLIQPTVVGAKETVRDEETGVQYVAKRALHQRVNRVADRVESWLRLQRTPDDEKRVAIIYYNYPPGKQNIGASYLNVLPGSLWQMVETLDAAGYDLGDRPDAKEDLKDAIFHHRNLGNWAPAELDKFVREHDPPRVSVNTYRSWLDELPAEFVDKVDEKWGSPEESDIMVWHDEAGKAHIIIPAIRYGNIMLTAQPARGWGQDLTSLYHDTTLPPHHQYVAFYLFMKKQFDAHALVHVGTHGTHEWLPGKEAGLEAADPPEALIQDLPNIYPYIVDDVGEGLQAKRRGQAVIIDHMTPPLDESELNPELRRLSDLIDDYNVASQKSRSVARKHFETINDMAEKKGILKDLGMTKLKGEDDLEELEHYLKRLSEKATPFGLHTFGKVPDDKYRRSTAGAILKSAGEMSPDEKRERLEELDQRITAGARRELASLIAALDGQYVPAGTGNDPIRNPASLPTGKNFYSFDARRIPTPETYEMGASMAEELVEEYREKHGEQPEKLTFTLWAVETIRHEGVMESQIMNLLGIRPRWDDRGQVQGVEGIPREELGRPRIDVVMVPSGLYRDLFSNLMHLLDQAVSRARDQKESDNILRANVRSLQEKLIQQGMSADRAKRLASVRIFSQGTGSYGTGLCDVIPASQSWEDEQEVAEVYFMRMGHLFGQGFWGSKSVDDDAGDVDGEAGQQILKDALSGTKMSVHSLSSSVYATLDNDDFFQYLGGTALAVRAVDGESPELYVSDMADPNTSRQVTLSRVLGTEMRSRYLNPKWVDEMLAEGYSGARFVDRVVEHLWGWQVTAPEVVGEARWREMYETYVEDKYELDIRERMEEAGNPWAHQSVVARMLEVVRKGYWEPKQEVIDRLAEEYAQSVEEEGLACCDHTCNNPVLTEYTSSVLSSVPGLENMAQNMEQSLENIKKTTAPARRQKGKQSEGEKEPSSPSPKPSEGDTQDVEGYEMEETTSAGASSAPIPHAFLTGFLAFLALVAWGWRRRGR